MSDSFEHSPKGLSPPIFQVQIDNKRYACEACIKGHRSSTCKHTERPLFEIKGKGRPVTQCGHCRELRKRKQVHVKCICGSRDLIAAIVPNSSKTAPANPPFLDGIPGITVSEGEHAPANPCSCHQGGVCQCYTPRKRSARHCKTRYNQLHQEPNSSTTSEKKQMTSSSSSLPPSQALARIAELRPDLPGPSDQYINLAHDPSSDVGHSHAKGHYNVAFSPYSHAYDMVRSQDPVQSSDLASEQYLAEAPQNLSNLTESSSLRDPLVPDWPADFDSWFSVGSSFPSTCQCGAGCPCPGCTEHNGDGTTSPSTSAYSGCANPGTCAHCLDCTILSLPASVPPNTTLSELDANQAQSIDEWIQQLCDRSNLTADL